MPATRSPAKAGDRVPAARNLRFQGVLALQTVRAGRAGISRRRVDAPGYGISRCPTVQLRCRGRGRRALIRATAGERNVVFGHSMGGQITPRILLKRRIWCTAS